MKFEERSREHAEALRRQLVVGFNQYAADVDLKPEKLVELLHEKGVTEYRHEAPEDPHPYDEEITEDFAEFMLEAHDQLGIGDVLMLLEAMGCQVQVSIMLPPETSKRLMTPGKQHRLQVARTLNDVPSKLQKRMRGE